MKQSSKQDTTRWWSRLWAPAVVRRGLVTSVIIGPILTAINHYDLLMGAPWTRERLIKIVLTFCVPYGVSVSSSVLALRQHKDHG